MADSYTVLAPIYDIIGMSNFSREKIEQILDYALANDWLGQRITDFGCGTGLAAAWLAEDRFRVKGVDSSDAMIEFAQQRNSNAEFVQADIRTVGDSLGQTDMLFAFDVVNEMESLKNVKDLLKSAYTALPDGMWFIFDVHTVEGLTKRGTSGREMLHDDKGVLVVVDNMFDYERQAATRTHTAFTQGNDGTWLRQDTERILRGYPLQALATLIQRAGFSDVALLDTRLQPLRGLDGYDRVIIVAKR